MQTAPSRFPSEARVRSLPRPAGQDGTQAPFPAHRARRTRRGMRKERTPQEFPPGPSERFPFYLLRRASRASHPYRSRPSATPKRVRELLRAQRRPCSLCFRRLPREYPPRRAVPSRECHPLRALPLRASLLRRAARHPALRRSSPARQLWELPRARGHSTLLPREVPDPRSRGPPVLLRVPEAERGPRVRPAA